MILTPDRRLILGLVFFFLLFIVIYVAQKQPIIETQNTFSSQMGGANDTINQPESKCLNDPKYTKLGYDNPYIFPYQNINLNHPANRSRYPHWCRQLKLDSTGYRGFPGFPGYFY